MVDTLGQVEPQPSVESGTIAPSIDPLIWRRPSLWQRASDTLNRWLIVFSFGVAATLGWQSYGDEARALIATSWPQLGWLAPKVTPVPQTTADLPATSPANVVPELQQLKEDLAQLKQELQQLKEMPSAFASLRQTVDQLSAGQQQMAGDIAKLSTRQQQIAGDIALLSTRQQARLGAAPAHPKPVVRPSPAGR